MKANLAVLLSLVCATQVAAISAQADSEEGLARRAERIVAEMQSPADYAAASVPTDTLMIYSSPEGRTDGVAARLNRVARYKNFLFLYNEFDRGPKRVSYFTAQGAQEALVALKTGKSIDVSGCMKAVRFIDSMPGAPTDHGYCSISHEELALDCNRFDLVDLQSISDTRRYKLKDIEAEPMIRSDFTCFPRVPGL
jgi:hypothetical protein